MGTENLPFISFMFMPLRALPASRRFLNWTKAKPRTFPSVCKHNKDIRGSRRNQQTLRRTMQQPGLVRRLKPCQASQPPAQSKSLYPANISLTQAQESNALNSSSKGSSDLIKNTIWGINIVLCQALYFIYIISPGAWRVWPEPYISISNSA